MFHHAPVLVLALGIGIGIGQYYWVLGALLGIVLTLDISKAKSDLPSFPHLAGDYRILEPSPAHMLTCRFSKISRICTDKFGQLILSKLVKIIATRCHILRLKCTKFNFGYGGGAHSIPPDTLAGFKGSYF